MRSGSNRFYCALLAGMLLLLPGASMTSKGESPAPSKNTTVHLASGEIPFIPMGAITGRPTRERVRATLEQYRAAGITQFLVYPRAGCELEYMADEWLDTCEAICEEAQKLGFTSIWLYDEFNWPSGTCNKQVMKVNPDFEMKQLCVHVKNGEYKTVVRRNPNMSDLMNPEAVECFIKMTHEKYYARLGKYFGTLIKGIFTDEPDIGYFDYSNKKDVFRMPWYSELPADYAKATGGRDLLNDITAGVKAGTNEFVGPCNKLLGTRYRKVFIDRISQWCGEHRILATGHMMNESSVAAAQRSNGHALLALGGLTLPGIDEIFTHRTIEQAEWLTFSTGMYAIEKQGNKGGLAEFFAIGPCDLSFTRLVKQLYLGAAFGIDHYVLAVAPLDARGNVAKDRYYCVFTADQPHMTPDVWKVWAESARRAADLATKERDCEIAVRYPYTDVDLPALLRTLVRYQCSWRVLLPEEKPAPDAKFVLQLASDGLREENTGTKIDDFNAFYREHVLPGLKNKAVVVDANGRQADNVFVRRYKDGSALAIDFSGTRRSLSWRRLGIDTPFTLEADGVAELTGWNITLDRPNVMRLEIDAKTNEFTFTLAEPMADLCLAVREYGEPAELELDGQKIEARQPCTVLPQGFNDLYRVSKITLQAGVHRVKLANGAKYHAFLPYGFLVGTFSREKASQTLARNGGSLYGYSGTITQNASIRVPADAVKAAIDMPSGDAELKIDGKSLGVRIAAPYRWVLPDTVRGKTVELSVIRHTSIRPMFGDIRPKSQWVAVEESRICDDVPRFVEVTFD